MKSNKFSIKEIINKCRSNLNDTNIIKDRNEEYQIVSIKELTSGGIKFKLFLVYYKKLLRNDDYIWEDGVIYQVFINYSWHYVYIKHYYDRFEYFLTNVIYNGSDYNLLLSSTKTDPETYINHLSKIININKSESYRVSTDPKYIEFDNFTDLKSYIKMI